MRRRERDREERRENKRIKFMVIYLPYFKLFFQNLPYFVQLFFFP